MFIRIGFIGALLFALMSNASISGQNLLTDQPVQVTAGKKGTVIIFMSAKCPCSNSHVPLVKSLVSDFKNFSFVIVHSNTDENLELSKAYFKSVGISIPVIQDQNAKMADEFKAFKTPHAFVLTTDGKILYQGGVTSSAIAQSADRQYLREALTDIEADHAVKTPEGRTLGCIISRGDQNVW